MTGEWIRVNVYVTHGCIVYYKGYDKLESDRIEKNQYKDKEFCKR